MKSHLLTILLLACTVVMSVVSLFVGVIDLDLSALFAGETEQLEILLISRLPRLLAVLCTAWQGGVAYGAVLGVVVGASMDLACDGIPLYAMAFGLAGMGAGLRRGKVAVATERWRMAGARVVTVRRSAEPAAARPGWAPACWRFCAWAFRRPCRWRW